MEIPMSRTFAIAAILALSTFTAGADPLSVQVHDAAVKACAAESSDSLPLSYYGAITTSCIARVQRTAMRKIEADAQAKTRASTASAGLRTERRGRTLRFPHAAPAFSACCLVQQLHTALVAKPFGPARPCAF